jgi:hypothetical protein
MIRPNRASTNRLVVKLMEAELGHPTALVTLVEEFVEAALDTIELALDPPEDIVWRSHAEYLKGLLREANVMLAHLDAAEA